MAQKIALFVLLLQLATAGASQSGQLTAGDVDDNLNFEWYQGYKSRAENHSSQLANLGDVSDRILVDIIDSAGEPFSCATVEVTSQTQTSTLELPAGSNGLLQIFPGLDQLTFPFSIRAKPPGGSCPEDCSTSVEVSDSTLSATLNLASTSTLPNQLDVAFILDTTGSMCDELSYVQVELADILSAVEAANADVSTQLGVVLYKDHGDEYVTQKTDLTAGVSNAIAALQGAGCSGGGDYPEAMNEALEQATTLQWRTGNTARVAFLVADAPPHDTDLGNTLQQALELRKQGVKVYALAGSGVGDSAEYMMRLMALVTGARHLWLTDDSGIGNSHQEPKVLCFRVTRLDQLLVRVLNGELQGHRIEATQSQIIREAGRQEHGICMVDFQSTTTSTTTSGTETTASTVSTTPDDAGQIPDTTTDMPRFYEGEGGDVSDGSPGSDVGGGDELLMSGDSSESSVSGADAAAPVTPALAIQLVAFLAALLASH